MNSRSGCLYLNAKYSVPTRVFWTSSFPAEWQPSNDEPCRRSLPRDETVDNISLFAKDCSRGLPGTNSRASKSLLLPDAAAGYSFLN